MNREHVYKLIDEERDYQDKKWDCKYHSIEEWLVYIEDYVNETKHLLSRNSSEESYIKAKWNLRKIAALGICSLEQHDAMTRKEEELENKCGNQCECSFLERNEHE
jgi:hypothetical protein